MKMLSRKSIDTIRHDTGARTIVLKASGSNGFLYTDFGEHTETAGVMKNVSLPKIKALTGYTWIQGGITSYTGNAQLESRFYSDVSLGAVIHFNKNNSIWIQESYNKVVTVPWYTTSSIGYTYSW